MKLLTEKYRSLAEKKFWMDQGGVTCFWNEDVIRDPSLQHMPLVITEGEPDGIVVVQSGHAKAVSVPNGVDSNLEFLEDDLKCLPNEAEIILAVDRDAAGAKLGKRLLKMLGPARCSYVVYPKGCKDFNDVALKHGNDVVLKIVENRKPYPIQGLTILADYPDVSHIETFSTGWNNLDQHFKPWRGEFVVVTGVPGSGKSLFVNHLAAKPL